MKQDPLYSRIWHELAHPDDEAYAPSVWISAVLLGILFASTFPWRRLIEVVLWLALGFLVATGFEGQGIFALLRK